MNDTLASGQTTQGQAAQAQQMNALKNTLIDIGRGSRAVEKKGLKENRYGILGLLDIIQGGDPSISILSLGLDLKEISPQAGANSGKMYAHGGTQHQHQNFEMIISENNNTIY